MRTASPADVPEFAQTPGPPLSRRTVLRVGGIGAMAAALMTVGNAAWMPQRAKSSTMTALPDIQFDIGAFVHPAQTIAGVEVDFGVLYTFLAPAALNGSDILNGSFVPSPKFNGLFRFRTPRLNFVQPGLPRKVAAANGFSFTNQINPASSMWMGFVDQQTAGSAANGATVTFAGTASARLTTARPGDYFDNGSIQHLSHDIQDLAQFYNTSASGPEPFSERVQYMFRSKTSSGAPGLPFPEDPNDPFTNGGGLGAPTGDLATQQQSAFLQNQFFGTNDQATNFDPAVTDHQKYRVGHLTALQRSSRASDGTPLHIRNDGPGIASMDVPDGSVQPTLEFMIFVPTAEFFRVMRINSASLDFVKAGEQGGTAASVPPGVEAADAGDDGLERFLTATRRQNFLVPPRRNRSFPLLELT